MATNLDDLFTVDSLLTLQGGMAVCYIVPNVLGTLIPGLPDLARKWIAFVLAMAVALTAASIADGTGVLKWVVAVLNGFLIAASAFGINEVTAGSSPRGSAATPKFRLSWR